MGLTYAKLELVNLFNKKQVSVNALVDSGATHMCVTAEVALQLGYDIEEVASHVVTLADDRQTKAPRIGPIEIRFENRTYMTEAMVLGDESLMGVLPLEAMDLVLDPRGQRLMVNPAHPNYPVAHVK